MKKSSLLILMIMLMLTVFISSGNVKASTPTMYVAPQISTVEIHTTFQINVSVSQVTDLAAWEFKLYYPNKYLNATQIQEGSFLKTAGQTSFFVKEFTDNYNETHGVIWAFCTLIGQGPGATGNGTLATVTFKAKFVGTAVLKLAETDMLDSQMPPNHISHVTKDGTVNIIGHDIAVTHVIPLKTIIGQGCTANINVIIVNQGAFTETFNVTLYANTTLIETKEITLNSNASIIITFTWNTTGFVKGNYTAWAYAWPVQGETETEDNTFTDGVVYVGIPGDINGDGIVDIYDALLLAGAYGATSGQPNWNPNIDINGDGIVDIYDAIILAGNYGEADP